MLGIFIFLIMEINNDSLYFRAGENVLEVKKFLTVAYEQGYREWADFLLKNMPDVDLVNLTTSDFIEYLKALKKNYERVAWRAKITPELFYHYILPYRVSQEPLENFTSLYADSLYEIVKDVKSMRQAVFRINEWVYTKARYEPTERWDQTALATVMRGTGRCEELSILLIKALRTVIIPARHTYTPWWSHTNSNHAWVEVWVDGRWYALGASELTNLNDGWFMNDARRTAIIKSLVFGPITTSQEIIDRQEKTYSVINATSNYTHGTWLTVRVLKNLIPEESAIVSINVYNYASLVPCGVKKTDSRGEVSWYLGSSDLFIYAQKDSLIGFEIWRPHNEPSDTIIINLTYRELPDTAFWLRTGRILTPKAKSEYRPDFKTLNLLRQKHERQINIVNQDLELTLRKLDSNLVRIFSQAYARARELVPYYFDLPEAYKELFVKYFINLVSKDIVMSDSSGLLQELMALKYALSLADPETPESIIHNYLITPRILFERMDKWHALLQAKLFDTLPELFVPYGFVPVKEKVRALFDWTDNHIALKQSPEPFGPQMNPADVLRARRGTQLERYIFIAGALRTVGVPARIKWDYEGVEYWDKTWHEYSFDKKAITPKHFIRLRFFKNNQNVTPGLKYYEDFSISQFQDMPVRLDLEPELIDSSIVVQLNPGVYYLIYGWRNGFGDSYVWLKKLQPQPDTFESSITLSFPEDISGGDLVTRGWSTPKVLRKALQGSEPILIIVFDQSEASRATLLHAQPVLANFSGKILFVPVAQEDIKSNLPKELGIKNYRLIYHPGLVKELAIKELPSVIYLRNQKCLLWLEGLNLELGRILTRIIH
ncbi:MAG: transglutaminase domain-containing protein [candidate division WOR-3 bacterium]